MTQQKRKSSVDPISHLDENGSILDGKAYGFDWPSLSGTDSTVLGENHTIIREIDGKPVEMPYGGWATIAAPNPAQRASDDPKKQSDDKVDLARIKWQEGPVNREAGQFPNGIFVEDLLEIALERLELYQNSPFACAENAEAIMHTKSAVKSLMSRRTDRRERGVEGINAE